jgi:hypothetical protein
MSNNTSKPAHLANLKDTPALRLSRKIFASLDDCLRENEVFSDAIEKVSFDCFPWRSAILTAFLGGSRGAQQTAGG